MVKDFESTYIDFYLYICLPIKSRGLILINQTVEIYDSDRNNINLSYFRDEDISFGNVHQVTNLKITHSYIIENQSSKLNLSINFIEILCIQFILT